MPIVEGMLVLMQPDPSWFYSSVAQATAALVGFAGAFLLFRLQDYTSRWQASLDQLGELQRRWVSADIVVSQQEQEFWATGETNYVHRGQTVDLALERRRDDVWRLLRPLLDRQAGDRFPRELGHLVAVLGALFVVGCVVPLVELGSPSNRAQALVVAPIGSLVAATGVLMYVHAKRTFSAWKGGLVAGRASAQHEHELLEEEAFHERMLKKLDTDA